MLLIPSNTGVRIDGGVEEKIMITEALLQKKGNAAGGKTLGRSLFSILSSVRFTVLLLAIVIPATILGGLIPQGRPFQEYVVQFGWSAFQVIHFLWLDKVFSSFWYVGLLFLLGLNVLVCTAKSLIEGRRRWGFVIVHLSLLFLIAGGVMSGIGRVRGEMQIFEGESVDSFFSQGRIVPLGFQVRLTDFELQQYDNPGERIDIQFAGKPEAMELYFKPGVWTPIKDTGYELQVERYVPDFRYDIENKSVITASQEPHNPAILAHVKKGDASVKQWLFGHHPDAHGNNELPFSLVYHWKPTIPKDFISHLEVLEEGEVVKEKVIEVNHPLRHKGFSIYQSSYDSAEKKWTGLAVVQDPGVGFVYVGIGMLMMGLFHNIYLAPLFKKNGKGV